MASEQTPLLLPSETSAANNHYNHSQQEEETGHDMTESDADAVAVRRALRKVDWRLIPLLFVTYMLNFMDKTILSSASVFGLIDDTVSFWF
jgi:hypothetical protein